MENYDKCSHCGKPLTNRSWINPWMGTAACDRMICKINKKFKRKAIVFIGKMIRGLERLRVRLRKPLFI